MVRSRLHNRNACRDAARSPLRSLGTNERPSSRRAAKYTSPYRDVVRAKIVLMAADGLRNDVIASRLSLQGQIVSKWRKRFF
jgi:hypothetical protein